jgi:beta-N-acetylhexosaminidase
MHENQPSSAIGSNVTHYSEHTTHDLHALIGRLIWVGVRGSHEGDPVLEAELKRCEDAAVGGIILFDVDVPHRDAHKALGNTEEQARFLSPRNIIGEQQVRTLVSYLRSRLGKKLIVCIDQEGGRVSRLNPARGFPLIPSPDAYARLDLTSRAQVAMILASTIASAGIDLNLSPCVDVAINPDGPGHTALGRSFNAQHAVVSSMAAEQIRALHAAGIGACIKHFPGHGSARGDTHEGLVDITQTWIESDELAPYAALINSSDPPEAVMISHLVHKGLDPHMPASVSRNIITGLLRERLGWSGLVITDSLDMRAVADRFSPGDSSVLALQAGADVALEANNLAQPKPCPAPEIHAAITQAVKNGRLSIDRLQESVARLDRLLLRLHGLRNGAAHV